MKKRIIALSLAVVSVVAAIAASVFVFSDEDSVLRVGVGCLSGELLPHKGMLDGDALLYDVAYSPLVDFASDGSVIFGDETQCAARSFRAYYANGDFEESAQPSQYTAFEFILKNGMKFSDGSDVTVDDVLFSLYYYVDPVCGTEGFSALPIAGKENYIYQKGDMNEFVSVAADIAANGVAYVPTEEDSFTIEQAVLFWNSFDDAGEEFVGKIIECVSGNYCTEALVSAYILEGVSADSVKADSSMLTAYAMMLWNYGTFVYSYEPDEQGEYIALLNEDGSYSYKTTLVKALEGDTYVDFVIDDDGDYRYDYDYDRYVKAEDKLEGEVRYSKVLSDKYITVSKKDVIGFRDVSGKRYSLEGEDAPSLEVFFSLMKDSYTQDGVLDYTRLEKTEAANEGDNVYQEAVIKFAKAQASKTPQKSIKGIVSDVTDVDGTSYNRITIYLEGNCYEKIEEMGVCILSKAHLTSAYTCDGVSAFGMPLSDEVFLTHIKGLTTALGSGPYVFSEFSSDTGRAFLEANKYFEAMGMGSIHNAYIEQLEIVQVPLGEEMSMTESGDVDVCLVASSEAGEKSIECETASYKYVLVNPTYYININARKAIFSLMDTSFVGERGLDFSVPGFLWAYPEGSREPMYDATLTAARGYFEAAGYSFDENGEMIDPLTKKKAYFTLSLLPGEADGEIHKMFEKTAEHLRSLGADAEVVFDSDLMYNIYSDDGVAIYAMGWETNMDGGLYDRYAVSSQSEAVKANGILSININGQLDNFGTVAVTDASGTSTEINTSEATSLVDELILKGKNAANRDVRRGAYTDAIAVLSELYFELPLFTESYEILISDNVKPESLALDCSSFSGPLSRIWEVRLAGAGEAAKESTE